MNNQPKGQNASKTTVLSSAKTITTKVTFSRGVNDQVHLPSHIKERWRHDLEHILRKDIGNKQFGPRRHHLPMGYTLMYRVDVDECVLLSLATDGNANLAINGDSINLFDALQTAQIWLTYPEEECGNNQPDGASMPDVVLSSPTPSQLSQTTLVEDETSDIQEIALNAPKPKTVTFSDAPTIFHISTQAAPNPRLFPPGLHGYSNRHRFTSHPMDKSVVKLRSALKSRHPSNDTPVRNHAAPRDSGEPPTLPSKPHSSMFQNIKKVLSKFARPPLPSFDPMRSSGLQPRLLST